MRSVNVHSRYLYDMAYAATKERAHELIERVAPEKVPAVVELLEKIVSPVRRSLLDAPFEDERISEEESRVASEARARGYVASRTSHEDLLKEFGLTTEDFERMAHEPLEASVPKHE